MNLLIGIVIALIFAGFLFWAVRMVVDAIPMDAMFKQIIHVILLIVAVGVIIFYVVIPLLHELAGISVHIGGLH